MSDLACCPRCGQQSRYSGRVMWCGCSGWLDAPEETEETEETEQREEPK